MPTSTELPRSNERLLGLSAGYGVGGAVALVAMLILTALWSAYDLVVRKSSYLLTRSDLLLAIPATVLVGVQLIFAVINSGSYHGDVIYLVTFMGPLALYLLVWLIIPKLRQLKIDSLDSLILLSSMCAIAPLPVALYEVFINADRATGLTGNALPFALVSAIFSVLSLFNILSSHSWRPYLGLAGYGCGLVCLFLSGSIGLLPVVIPASIVFAIVYRRAFLRWYNRISITLGAILLVLIGIAASQWTDRLVNMVLFVFRPDGTKKFTTFNLRIQMWDAAVDLIKARPFLGHGMQNRVALLHEKTGLEFVQFHNGFLNAWVDSGIIGVLATAALLFAPLWIAFKAPRDVAYGKRFFIAVYLTALFFVGGMSYVIFLDFVYDSVFLWVAIAIAASVPISSANPLYFQTRAGT